MGDFPFKSVGGSPSGMFTRLVTALARFAPATALTIYSSRLFLIGKNGHL